MKRLVCVLLIVTVACLSVPELNARNACQIQAFRNYKDDQRDCSIQLASGIALCHMSLLVPAAFLVCQTATIGLSIYCFHRAQSQYQATMLACAQS